VSASIKLQKIVRMIIVILNTKTEEENENM